MLQKLVALVVIIAASMLYGCTGPEKDIGARFRHSLPWFHYESILALAGLSVFLFWFLTWAHEKATSLSGKYEASWKREITTAVISVAISFLTVQVCGGWELVSPLTLGLIALLPAVLAAIAIERKGTKANGGAIPKFLTKHVDAQPQAPLPQAPPVSASPKPAAPPPPSPDEDDWLF